MRQILPFVVLTLLAGAILWFGEATFELAGFKPLHPLSAHELDEPAAPDDREMPQFLGERNQVTVTVPREMTLGDFLRLNQLTELPHVRQQIAKQEGAAELPDDHRLAPGKRFTFTLTPPAVGVP